MKIIGSDELSADYVAEIIRGKDHWAILTANFFENVDIDVILEHKAFFDEFLCPDRFHYQVATKSYPKMKYLVETFGVAHLWGPEWDESSDLEAKAIYQEFEQRIYE